MNQRLWGFRTIGKTYAFPEDIFSLSVSLSIFYFRLANRIDQEIALKSTQKKYISEKKIIQRTLIILLYL